MNSIVPLCANDFDRFTGCMLIFIVETWLGLLNISKFIGVCLISIGGWFSIGIGAEMSIFRTSFFVLVFLFDSINGASLIFVNPNSSSFSSCRVCSGTENDVLTARFGCLNGFGLGWRLDVKVSSSFNPLSKLEVNQLNWVLPFPVITLECVGLTLLNRCRQFRRLLKEQVRVYPGGRWDKEVFLSKLKAWKTFNISTNTKSEPHSL